MNRSNFLLTVRRQALDRFRHGIPWCGSNHENLGMDRRDPDRDQLIRKALHRALWTVLCAVLLLDSCSRSSESRIRVELHDLPEAIPTATALRKPDPPSCPPGDPANNDALSIPAGEHKVTLSWKASTSSGSDGKDIHYCLYRTKGGRVQANAGTKTKSPCVNCQRVTLEAVTDTIYKDDHVENDSHYCYVAIAIQTGNGNPSSFSNQADAVIPPRKEAPFCNPPGSTKTTVGATQHGTH
jgi:hypothetical protein